MRRWMAVLAVGLLGNAGCAASPRVFFADDRLTITAPASLSIVAAPFLASWETRGRTAAAYAVFVDLAPVPPGHGMRDLADDQCKRLPTCPDAAYLAGRGVFVTKLHRVVVPTLPFLAGVGGRATHVAHSLTVVELDAHGRRRGDVAWEVEFRD